MSKKPFSPACGSKDYKFQQQTPALLNEHAYPERLGPDFRYPLIAKQQT